MFQGEDAQVVDLERSGDPCMIFAIRLVLCHEVVDLFEQKIEPFVDLLEPNQHLIPKTIHLFETPVDFFEAPIHPFAKRL
jgi:hypothetical protein